MKKVVLEGATFNQAIAQIELMDNVSPKNNSCIRLLTEEAYSMFYELLETKKLDFALEKDNSKFTITFQTRAWTNEETKEQFLKVSSSGKNDAYKGIKGFFKSIIDSLLLGASVAGDGCSRAEFGFSEYECDFYKVHRWQLSEYIERTPVEKVKAKWDELEKSIIMNFADDISISMRDDVIEMSIIKSI